MKLLLRCCISLLLAALCACASKAPLNSGSDPASEPLPAEAAAPEQAAAEAGSAELLRALPPLPAGHTALGLQETSRTGSATFNRSANAVDVGNTLELDAPAGGLSWGIWELPASDELRYLDFALDVPAGSEAWLALADYSRGAWVLTGPVFSSRVLELDPLLHTSPAELMYAAVLVQRGDAANVSSLALIAFHANTAPSAALEATPLSGTAPLSVAFDAGDSTDPDEDIVRYLWDFNGSGGFESQTLGPLVSHTYTEAGVYQARMAAEDSQGERDIATVQIEVNAPPTAVLSLLPPVIKRHSQTTLDAALSLDPDGSITEYEWDADGNGSFETSSGTAPQFNASFEQPGFYTLRLRVTDNDGASTQVQAVLKVEGWSDKQRIHEDNVGFYTSMAIVAGNPAASFVNSSDLYFIRALDERGDAWAAAVLVDDVNAIAQGSSLAVINGRPAISYQNSTTQVLRYCRAGDATGSTWGTPVIPDSTAPTGFNSSLRTVNGAPAIAYFDDAADNLAYVRSTDSDGMAWGMPVYPDSLNDTGRRPCMAIVNGNPAISYQYGTGQDLRYVRAMDPNGAGWNMPIDVETFDNSFSSSLAVINGMPAIAFQNQSGNHIQFSRALDPDGASWASPVNVNLPGAGGLDPQLALFAGAPVVCFDDGSRLAFCRASDALGNGWYYPEIADGDGNTGESPSMVIAAGQPAMVFQDDTANALGFVRYQP